MPLLIPGEVAVVTLPRSHTLVSNDDGGDGDSASGSGMPPECVEQQTVPGKGMPIKGGPQRGALRVKFKVAPVPTAARSAGS